MYQPRTYASDPNLRATVLIKGEIGNPAVPQHGQPSRGGTRIILGPHAFQCLEVDSDSSSSSEGSDGDRDDDGEEGDDEHESDPPSYSSGVWSVCGGRATFAPRSPARSDNVVSERSDRSRGVDQENDTRTRRETARRHSATVPTRGSPAQITRPTTSAQIAGKTYGDPDESLESSSRYPAASHPALSASAVNESRSQSTPPVLLTAETNASWSRTQPGLEVNLILPDADTGLMGRNAPHDEAEQVIRRMEMLEELFAGQHLPKYRTSMMPHAKASRRPQLATIASANDSPTKTRRDMSVAPASLGPRPSLAPRARTLTSTLAKSDPSTLHFQRGSCDACGRTDDGKRKVRMIPCDHIVCSTCFGSALSAVSAKCGQSKCAGCLTPVDSFIEAHCFNIAPISRIKSVSGSGRTTDNSSQNESSDSSRGRSGTSTLPTSLGSSEDEKAREPTVMRIDNVAWDITPAVVTSFLPPDVLSTKTVCPVHVLLDRFDGRTRDYLYIEVASQAAARKILQSRQNSLMPCGPLSGGKRRPVTITLVPHQELLDELRPRCAAELDSLLNLCEAAVTIPYLPTLATSLEQNEEDGVKQRQVHDRSSGYISGAAHFVKSRHGPFYALMSTLSKLGGRKSPAYWDLYRVTSGAIASLAAAVDRSPFRLHARPHPGLIEDKRVLAKLRGLHQRSFSSDLPNSPE